MKKLATLMILAGTTLLAQTLSPPPIPVVTAKYFGASGGSTARYYWVQAIFTFGRSGLSNYSLVTTISALSGPSSVNVSWRPIPGAIAYDVLETSSSTPPTGACNCALAVNVSNTAARDTGAGYLTYTVNQGYASFIYPVSSNTATNTATLTVAQVTGGVLIGTPTSAATYTTPTATAIIAALPNCYVGASFPLTLINTSGGSNTITMAGGTNVTLIGTGTATQSQVRNLLFIVTACLGTPALNMQSLTTGAY